MPFKIISYIILIYILIEFSLAKHEVRKLHVTPSNNLTARDSYNQIKWNNIIKNEDLLDKFLDELKKTKSSEKTTEITTVGGVSNVTTTSVLLSKQYTSTTKRYKGFLNILMFGSPEDLRGVSRKKVLNVMKSIGKLNLPLQKKLIIWEIYKDFRRVETLRENDLEMIGDLLIHIPENDLFMIDVLDDDILHYLGTSQLLTRRKACIFAYVLKTNLNFNILTNSSAINKIKGLLCGFSKIDLSSIKVDVITEIDSEVFNNLWACSDDQLSILLHLIMSSRNYAYIETWTGDLVRRLGFLILVLTPDQFKKFETDVIAGLSKNIICKLELKQLTPLIGNMGNLSYDIRTIANYKMLTQNSRAVKLYISTFSYVYCIILLYFNINFLK